MELSSKNHEERCEADKPISYRQLKDVGNFGLF